MAYRASKHAATGLSPNMMTFGREINLPMTAVIGRPPQENVSVEQHIESIQQKLVEAHEQARQSLQKQAAYQKRHYDIKSKERQLDEGQAVWLYEPTSQVGVCAKLAPKWKGPYLVTRRIDDIMYLVKRSRGKPAKAYHIDRLRLYRGQALPVWFGRYLKK